MLRADARNVRGGAVVGGQEAAGAGARPDGDQAAVLLPQRRRFVLWERTQGDSGAQPRSAAAGRAGAGPVSVGELRAGRSDADRRDPKGAAGAPARMEPGQVPDRAMVDRKSTRLNSSHLGISYAVF